MFEKIKLIVEKYRKECTALCSLVGIGVISWMSYQAGCQHGVDTIQNWFIFESPDLFENTNFTA